MTPAFSNRVFSNRLLWTFPCGEDKKPRTKRGFKDAVQNVWWPRFPLVGVPTGNRNGFDVLDIDGREGRRWYFRNCDALPPTRVHYTQRGVHLLFTHAPGLRCSTSRIAECVDVRSEGGYIVWWAREGLPIEDVAVAEWPEWLLKEAMGPAKGEGSEGPHSNFPSPIHGDVGDSPTTGRVGYRLNGILRKVERTKKGKRNDVLYWAACLYAEMIARHEVQVGIARRLLIAGCEVNGLWRDPHDGPERCMATIASAFYRVEQKILGEGKGQV